MKSMTPEETAELERLKLAKDREDQGAGSGYVSKYAMMLSAMEESGSMFDNNEICFESSTTRYVKIEAPDVARVSGEVVKTVYREHKVYDPKSKLMVPVKAVLKMDVNLLKAYSKYIRGQATLENTLDGSDIEDNKTFVAKDDEIALGKTDLVNLALKDYWIDSADAFVKSKSLPELAIEEIHARRRMGTNQNGELALPGAKDMSNFSLSSLIGVTNLESNNLYPLDKSTPVDNKVYYPIAVEVTSTFED